MHLANVNDTFSKYKLYMNYFISHNDMKIQ